jgi:hypothetical protein
VARALVLALLFALAACGGGISAAEVQEARDTQHAMTTQEILAIARGQLGEYYKVDDVLSAGRLITEERGFRDGVPFLVADSELHGGEGSRRQQKDIRANQFLRLRVTVDEMPSGGRTVTVTARLRTTNPTRTWDYTQAGLPGWAREEADALQVRIHRALIRAERAEAP